uniref:putative surface protein SACOL0050 n=1 Tax=Erigeron canadensis TaxID=72917 RepID=UPI001CB9C724|nr:putative surface protein SACOL0050 [Erigeron canadensis]
MLYQFRNQEEANASSPDEEVVGERQTNEENSEVVTAERVQPISQIAQDPQQTAEYSSHLDSGDLVQEIAPATTSSVLVEGSGEEERGSGPPLVIPVSTAGSAEPEVEAEEVVELTYEFELLLRYSDSDDSESSENASANDSDDDSSDDSDSSDDGNDEGVADSSDGSAATTETDTDESANERRTKLVHDVSAASESDHSHQSFVQEGVALHRERRSKACHAVPAVSDSAHFVHDAHSHIPDHAAQIDPDVAAQNDSELRGIFDDMDDPVNRASSVSPVKRTGGADLKYTRTKRRRVVEATSVAIPDPPRPTAAVIPAVSQAQVLRPMVAPSLSYRLPSDSSLVRRVDLLETQV